MELYLPRLSSPNPNLFFSRSLTFTLALLRPSTPPPPQPPSADGDLLAAVTSILSDPGPLDADKSRRTLAALSPDLFLPLRRRPPLRPPCRRPPLLFIRRRPLPIPLPPPILLPPPPPPPRLQPRSAGQAAAHPIDRLEGARGVGGPGSPPSPPPPPCRDCSGRPGCSCAAAAGGVGFASSCAKHAGRPAGRDGACLRGVCDVRRRRFVSVAENL